MANRHSERWKAHELFRAFVANTNVLPIPSGQWPDGTGGSPMLPIPTSDFRFNPALAANPAIASRLQFTRPEGLVAELVVIEDGHNLPRALWPRIASLIANLVQRVEG